MNVFLKTFENLTVLVKPEVNIEVEKYFWSIRNIE